MKWNEILGTPLNCSDSDERLAWSRLNYRITAHNNIVLGRAVRRCDEQNHLRTTKCTAVSVFFELAGSHKARDNGRSSSVPSSVHAGALRNRIMFSRRSVDHTPDDGASSDRWSVGLYRWNFLLLDYIEYLIEYSITRLLDGNQKYFKQ